MATDQPRPDANGRVTHPERYEVVREAATVLAHELSHRFVVSVEPNTSGKLTVGTTVAITPADRSCGGISFTLTDFPGVRVEMGAWFSAHFPRCGCDACDEIPEDVIRELCDVVEDLVAGRLVEWTDGARLGVVHSRGSGWSLLESHHPLRGHAGERHEWAPWPPR